MPKLIWTDDLSVGVFRFDSEHKKLIDLLNKLNEAMSQGQGQKVMSGILSELIHYTKTHFKNEEEAMEKANYAGLAEQKKQHSDFTEKIQDLQEQYALGKTSITIEVFNFLNSWVQKHIKTEDKKYAGFV